MDSYKDMTLLALEAAVQARIPTMLVGPPGTGKTQTIKELARKMGYHLETVIGSRMDPTDICGLPKGEELGVDDDGQTIFGTVYLAPDWQVRILNKRKVILFLDEFSNTSGEVRASMLNMLQDREFPSGHKMPQETIIIGAMNPTEEAADGFELDLPTTNRIFFMEWKPSMSSWCEGMLQAWGKEVSDKEMAWRRKIVKFIQENPGRLQMTPDMAAGSTESVGVEMNNPSAAEVYRYAWSSRRSWDNLSRALAEAPEDHAVQDLLSRGLVGASSSIAFREFLMQQATYDPNEVLDDPSKVDWDNISPNDLALLLRSVVDKVKEDTDNIDFDHVKKIFNLFKILPDKNLGDQSAVFMKEILEFVPKLRRVVPKETHKEIMDSAMELVRSYQKYSKKS